jgi:hypothetical protein
MESLKKSREMLLTNPAQIQKASTKQILKIMVGDAL